MPPAGQAAVIWRYLPHMRYSGLLPLYFFWLSAAGAEPLFARGGQVQPTASEERRAQLRSALQERVAPVAKQPSEAWEQSRRLSDQERLDLRKQLRWQRQQDPSQTP